MSSVEVAETIASEHFFGGEVRLGAEGDLGGKCRALSYVRTHYLNGTRSMEIRESKICSVRCL